MKSTVQTSFAAAPRRPLLKRPATLARRFGRFCVSPARSKTRLKVLSLATAPWRRKYNSRILRGPQLPCANFKRTISHTSPSGSCSGLLLGRRDASAIPSTPSAKKRSFHLYPVFALTPYSWQSARKLSVLIAFKANSILSSIGSVLLHGIELHLLASLPSKRYLCLEPIVLPSS